MTIAMHVDCVVLYQNDCRIVSYVLPQELLQAFQALNVGEFICCTATGSEPLGTIDACRVRLTPLAPAAHSRHEHEVAPQQTSLAVCRQGELLQLC
jgi:hypothetical protein